MNTKPVLTAAEVARMAAAAAAEATSHHWAVTIAEGISGSSPFIADQAKFILLGGIQVGPETLLRWYVFHVLFLPLIIVIFLAVHFWRIRKDGGISGPL